MAKNPFIVEPDDKKINLQPYEDRDGTIWNLWITVKNELSEGEFKRMIKGLQTVTQSLREGVRDMAPEAKLEWTEYSFARMVAYVVDWSIAHEPAFKLPPTRLSYEKLTRELFALIDEALEKHEADVNEQKKIRTTKPLPSAISA